MGLLSFFTSVYDADTLDTRFTTSATVPYQTVIDARSDPVMKTEPLSADRGRAQKAKWKTPEFYIYYCVFLFAIPYIFYVVYDVSRCMILSICYHNHGWSLTCL